MFRQKKQQSTSKEFLSLPDMKKKVLFLLQEYAGAAEEPHPFYGVFEQHQEEQQRTIAAGIRNCCSGNYGARELIRTLVKSFLLKELATEEKQRHMLIPFHIPEKMSARQQMETLIYWFDREKEEQGFRLLCEKSGWTMDGCTISEDEMLSAYRNIAPNLTIEDEICIIAQILYADTVGLGVVDTLNQQKGFIEEIQIGMSGKTEQQYDYKNYLLTTGKVERFSRDGIHIMAGGCTFWMKCLSFETEEELQRVLRNLVKNSESGELTRNHPMIVADTVDGRRITVSRPPVSDTWIGLIRKFDTVKEVSLEKLYCRSPEEKALPDLIRRLVRSGKNIAITGEMASGKTTLFRACLAETERNRNIRVIEVDSFELNVRAFLPEANVMTMRVTEQTPAEEVLAFARKTTGQIFAVGEINSAAVANMTMDLSKIASQLFFSAHYITTEHMIADFTNAKLCAGGYSKESLAELDVVRCLGYDIHLCSRNGRRYVQYINEVVMGEEEVSEKRMGYHIRQIYHCLEEPEGVCL